MVREGIFLEGRGKGKKAGKRGKRLRKEGGKGRGRDSMNFFSYPVEKKEGVPCARS